MTTAAQRIQIQHSAEQEIMRYARPDPVTGIRPHALWHKHVHNVDLDPMQVLKMQEMDDHRNTVDFSCRRTGKTAVKEMYCLEYLATTPFQEEGIVAPRLQQSQTNLMYHIDAIRRSPILSGWIGYKSGRRQIADTRYQFHNGSKAVCYGIMSQIDGDGLSIGSLEEIDDMPADRLFSRFLPMLGSARRLGVDSSVSFDPQIRITGVYKGADVLTQLIDTGGYHVLPPVDVYLGIELGILNQAFVDEMKEQLPDSEWIRQFLCINASAQNHIWEKYIRRAMAVGLSAGLQAACPLPGGRYRKKGLLSFGYDHSGHGESAHASKSALVVCEQVGNFATFPFVKTWPAGTDDAVVQRDLFGFWEYFRPDYAMGDAYGLGMLTNLNDMLFARGLTDIDRRSIGDGQSTASTWMHWPFAPIRFEGMTKHNMASLLRTAFHNGQAAIPYVDDGSDALRTKNAANTSWGPSRLDEIGADSSDFALFIRQLGNVKSAPAKNAAYNTYKMANPKIGDDLFDAACAAVYAMVTAGIENYQPGVVLTRRISQEQLLGQL
nr:MAG TPA: large terminase [Bacteriophage sp.]